jgi:PPOX class probable F420-dependent enzyme
MFAIPASHADLLTRPLIGDLATVRPDGDPTVSPMWFGWDGELLRFSHTSRRHKFRNIQHHPRVALCVVDPDNTERYLLLRGEVDSIEPDPTGTFHYELAARYGEQHPAPPPDLANRVIIAVRPFAHDTHGGSANVE